MDIKQLLKENSGMIITHSIAYLLLPRKVLDKIALLSLAFHSIKLLRPTIIKAVKHSNERKELKTSMLHLNTANVIKKDLLEEKLKQIDELLLTPDELGTIKEKTNQVDNRRSAANWLSWQFWKPSQILVETPKNLKRCF